MFSVWQLMLSNMVKVLLIRLPWNVLVSFMYAQEIQFLGHLAEPCGVVELVDGLDVNCARTRWSLKFFGLLYATMGCLFTKADLVPTVKMGHSSRRVLDRGGSPGWYVMTHGILRMGSGVFSPLERSDRRSRARALLIP